MPPKPKRTGSRSANGPERKPRTAKRSTEPVPPPRPTPAQPPPASRLTTGTALVVVLVALALVLAVVGVIRIVGGNDGFSLKSGVPTEASPGQLRDYASPSRPVYWVGPPQNGRLEVTRTLKGVYVRYLPPEVKLGAPARYTTIATYPLRGAYASLRRSAGRPGFGTAHLAKRALAVWRKSPGTSVYIAYPRKAYLIEVYDPSPVKARSLAISGLVVPVP